jgi:adenosylhomocysteine nucleosidase
VRCASADKFVDDAEQKSKLAKDFGAEICDMESAGILFTSKMNNVPCLLVKCISDSLTGGSGEYAQNAKKAASGFFNFAEKLANLL